MDGRVMPKKPSSTSGPLSTTAVVSPFDGVLDLQGCRRCSWAESFADCKVPRFQEHEQGVAKLKTQLT